MLRQVKICGLTRPEDIEAAIAAGADLLGFVVEADSPRRLTIAKAARLARPAKSVRPIVAVTVNMHDADIHRLMKQMDPDYIQLHGDESPKRAAYIGRRFGVKTIKAIGISGQDDLKKIPPFEGAADLILLDAKAPAQSGQKGGHGHAFDWSILSAAALPARYALAGGLNPGTVKTALSKTGAAILDVSSGAESAPGIKDRQKMTDFIKSAHRG